MSETANTPFVSLDESIATEAGAVAELAIRTAYEVITPDNLKDLQIRVTPTGHEVIDLEKYMDAPRRKHGRVTLEDAESFAAYINRHKTEATVLYASQDARTVTAIINDHAAAGPGWGDHIAVLKLKLTPEWQHWAAQDNKLLDQIAFAEHIEIGLAEIQDPPAADLLELAQNFRATKSVNFESDKQLRDGTIQLGYQETVAAAAGKKGQMVIPDEFTLGIIPWEGSGPWKVVARLRYRIPDQNLKIGYQLVRPADVLKAAFDEVLANIETGTELKPMKGTYGA